MSRTLIDLSGKQFGLLTVKERCGHIQRNTKQPTWLCVCDCGRSVIALGYQLRNGSQRSCGCLRAKNSTTHGLTKSDEYQSWRGMRERCLNSKNSHYSKYGGRGIKFCERWGKFENFYADMGKRPVGYSLERKNNNADYSPENCCWASPAEQSRNTSRSVMITWKGQTKCLKDWAAEIGITHLALKFRLKNWTLDKAMSTPKMW